MTRDSDGGIELAYYAGAGEGDAAASVWWSRSVDGSATFSPPKLVHQPITLLSSRSDPRWIGEYFGTAWADGNLHVAYVDNAGDASHVAFFRTAVP
jgi:hypothetical protein